MRAIGISKRFGNHPVLSDVNLAAETGETLAILGPSGCGKTTLLRIIAGLESADAGRIELAGEDLTQRPPNQRGIGFVFQDLALYPHLSVLDNLAFPLRAAGLRRAARLQRAQEMGTLVGIDQVLDKYPAELSGGERQRVALGRALVRSPRLLLLDEPLAHLDTHLRWRLRGEIAQWRKQTGATMIHVTHDASEAMALADRIAVMVQGRIKQLGTADELYRQPVDSEVATLVGDPPMNMIAGQMDGTGACQIGEVRLEDFDSAQQPTQRRVTIAFRPQWARLVAGDQGVAHAGLWWMQGEVVACHRYHAGRCVTVAGDVGTVLVVVDDQSALEVGQRLTVTVDRRDLRVFECAI